MMAQYLQIKAEHPDALLFYRMGDFYEMFFEDAVAAAEALDIALTKRGKHMGEDIAMCGVPVHAAESYLLTLIRKGFRVAVAEQMEDPAEAKKRGSKAVVKREVVRLVTPGTLTEESLLEARRHNFLAAYAEVRSEGALAWADISTGELAVVPCSRAELGPELARLMPRELIVSEALEADLDGLETDFGLSLTPLGRAAFDSDGGLERIRELFGVASAEAFGAFERAEFGALGAVIEYVSITQKGRLPLLSPPRRESRGTAMQIDAATRRNLELAEALTGGREGSLLWAIDRTLTAGGGRLLAQRLASPSRDLREIGDRLDAIDWAIGAGMLAEDLREELRRIPDLERAVSRLALERGGPRDLGAVRDALEAAGRLLALLPVDVPARLARAAQALSGHEELASLLGDALVADPPLLVRDGGFIAPGHDPELDDARRLRDEGRGVIAELQGQYASETGIQSLKIKHNNVLGYFVETTATHAERMLSPPLAETFIHRQTTASAVRFTTLELSQLETEIHNAGARALDIERRHFAVLSRAVLARAAPLRELARAVAELDVTLALARLARENDWTRPIVDDSRAFEIVGGRHPVVEQALSREGKSFVANDCALADGGEGAKIWIVTGPNMAGKSTFLRQNALFAVLAQAGAFVPARMARIGLVSQVFSRVGASDDLARGRSTFMVEMVETAAILNQADSRALVILDEIGRGTATWDGMSIAWAALEYLHEANRCRALFATHYHELTELAERLPGVRNATIAVKEWEGEVVFLHEVREGAADRSYGIQVARLAGLPPAVIARASVLLEALEKRDADGTKPAAAIDDLPLFSLEPQRRAGGSAAPSGVERRLHEIVPDELTPRQALDLVYELRAMLRGRGGP